MPASTSTTYPVCAGDLLRRWQEAGPFWKDQALDLALFCDLRRRTACTEQARIRARLAGLLVRRTASGYRRYLREHTQS